MILVVLTILSDIEEVVKGFLASYLMENASYQKQSNSILILFLYKNNILENVFSQLKESKRIEMIDF